MRKNFGTNPYFFPLPVLIVGSYDGDGSADESALDENGRISADLMQVLSYDPVERSYRVLGKTVGKAFAVCSELK
ncbi:hypothetical protein [Gemmiger sp.]